MNYKQIPEHQVEPQGADRGGEHVDQRLKEIETNVGHIPDDELQRMIHATQEQVTRLAQASLDLLDPQRGLSEQHPATRQLDLHFDAKERLLNILQSEMDRRTLNKLFVEEVQWLNERLPTTHTAFVVDRLWRMKNLRNSGYPDYSRDQLEEVYALLVREAGNRGLNAQEIENMTKEEFDSYIDGVK